MFKFEQPTYFYLCAALMVMMALIVYTWHQRRRWMRRVGDPAVVERLVKPWHATRWWLVNVLNLGIVAMLVIALANPQWGAKREKMTAKAADVFIALDISNSMLATDIPPDRLSRAKRIAEKLIDQLQGERIGLILFAGNAYLQMPLTLDYAAALMFVKSANSGLAGTQGTVFSEVIDLAERSFPAEPGYKKIMIMITDGEDQEEGAVEKAKTAAQNGLSIFTVGIGSDEGGFIPMDYGNREDYLRGETGQIVRTKVNFTLLKQLAEVTGGLAFSAVDENTMGITIAEQMDKLQKRETEQRSFTEFESYFQPFLVLALLLWLVATVIPVQRFKTSSA